MKRSEFLKLSCAGCLLGATGLASLLSSCATGGKGLQLYKAEVKNRQVIIPLEQLAAKEITVVRGKGLDYDIAVHRHENGQYSALLLSCTHFANPLVNTGNGYTCTQHGSVFDLNGKVKKGPASQPLKQLKCLANEQELHIAV